MYNIANDRGFNFMFDVGNIHFIMLQLVFRFNFEFYVVITLSIWSVEV